MDSFSQLGLAEPLAEALSSFGFLAPTPVQVETIPAILSRRDAIVESETGTGKTFAYLAPAFQMVSTLDRPGSGEPLALVAAPTQELAVQIGREAERLAKAAGLSAKTVVLLGGTPMEKQAAKLKAKPEIVVGTLGRLADLVALGRLRVSSLKLLVLDEADRLFAPETEELARSLLKRASSQAVRVLVSATIPERVRREMRPLLRDALEICPVGVSVMTSDVEHWCFYCDGRKRLDFTRRFEAAIRPERCLIFMSMATRVEKSAAALAHLGLPVEAIHAGLDKEDRRVALERFASGEVRYLLTSDLGARGLDIAGISHVLSLDLPEEPTVYTHRAGRTARAGAKGVSIVLADGVELARASKIAVKGGFVFRCKILEEGEVLEPTSEEFFARAAAAEEERMAAKAGRVRSGERREGGEAKRENGRRRPSDKPRAFGPERREGEAAGRGIGGAHRGAVRERRGSGPEPRAGVDLARPRRSGREEEGRRAAYRRSEGEAPRPTAPRRDSGRPDARGGARSGPHGAARNQAPGRTGERKSPARKGEGFREKGKPSRPEAPKTKRPPKA
jgi:superfamily II DNA/RNA helicase